MRADPTSDEMAALLQALERAERTIDEVPISSLRQLAELHDEAKAELETPATADRSANPYVERIATAMMKLRVQSG